MAAMNKKIIFTFPLNEMEDVDETEKKIKKKNGPENLVILIFAFLLFDFSQHYY